MIVPAEPTQEQQALRYAVALMKNALAVAGPAHRLNIAGKIHILCMLDEAFKERAELRAALDAAPAPQETPRRHNCPKCGWDQWDGPLYMAREGWSLHPKEMSERNLREALQFQCTRCRWREFDPIVAPVASGGTDDE